MDDKQVIRSIHLVDRRLYIMLHSGTSRRPEYASELEAIDREIAGLRRESQFLVFAGTRTLLAK